MKTLFSFIFAAVAAFALFVTTGCETEAVSDASVTVTPSYTKLRLGQSTTLTASGGWSYKWALSDSSAGVLSAKTGESVVYTATKSGTTQTITVSCNSGSSSTNSVSLAASATINQGAEEGKTETSKE